MESARHVSCSHEIITGWRYTYFPVNPPTTLQFVCLHQVFHNCSCVSASYPAGSSTSVRLGQCPHAKDCTRSFTSYMAVSVLSSFINSLGATPGYMVIIRSVSGNNDNWDIIIIYLIMLLLTHPYDLM